MNRRTFMSLAGLALLPVPFLGRAKDIPVQKPEPHKVRCVLMVHGRTWKHICMTRFSPCYYTLIALQYKCKLKDEYSFSGEHGSIVRFDFCRNWHNGYVVYDCSDPQIYIGDDNELHRREAA